MNIEAYNPTQSPVLISHPTNSSSTSASPASFDDVLSKIATLSFICFNAIGKMSGEDAIASNRDSNLNEKCTNFAEWMIDLSWTFVSMRQKYESRKEEMLAPCKGMVRAQLFLKEQLALLKQGEPSLFSPLNSEQKRFFLQFPTYDENSSTTVRDLTKDELVITLSSSDISDTDVNQICGGQISDQIFGQLLNDVSNQLEFPSSDPVSLSELEIALDSIEKRKASVEEILTRAGILQAKGVSAMINAQNEIENNISTMLESVCNVVKNPSEHSIIIENCQDPLPPSEKSSYLIYMLGLSILALSGLYFVRKSKQAKTEKLSESTNNATANLKYEHNSTSRLPRSFMKEERFSAPVRNLKFLSPARWRARETLS